MTTAAAVEYELADRLAELCADPLGFVLFAYPWGQPGELEKFQGPDGWQREFLIDVGREVEARRFNGIDPVAPIRMATASGHGIGKSTLVAWLVNWIMSTREGAQGTVTANTYVQLETKTWAQIQKWTRMCITSHWFNCTKSRLEKKEFPEKWFCTPQTCREENSEAFAGQHAKTSTSFYIFDEASLIPDVVWDVAEGGLTDGAPMIFAFGNPTRNTGKFYRAAFGSDMDRWDRRSIDSRDCTFPNKALNDEWIADYGIDSDFVRVRVRGLPPLASELQFIDLDRIREAGKRPIIVLPNEPLVAGVDVSGGGAAWNVIYFRRGMDGRSIPRIRIPGQAIRHDRGVLVGRLAEILADQRPERKITAMFIDSAFGSPIIERLRMLGYQNVHEVNFGSESPDVHQSNMRAYMWNRVKDWLLAGAIPADEDLAIQLGMPGYHLQKSNKLVLESKQDMMKRGEHSPDDADALALTFARPVAPPRPQAPFPLVRGGPWS